MVNDQGETLRWNAGSSAAQDHNIAFDQRPCSAENFNLEEQGQGNGSRSSRILFDVRRTRPDVQASTSGSDLKLRTRISGSKSIDGKDHPNDGDDRYEGRYERLWREGQRHYLTSSISCGWDSFPGRNSVMCQTSRSKNKPSHSNSIRSDWSWAGQDANTDRKHRLGATTVCDLRSAGEESGVHGAPPQGGTYVPTDELKHTSGQIGRPEGIQSQPHVPKDASSDPWFNEDEIDAKRQIHWHNAFAKLHGIGPQDKSSTFTQSNQQKRFSPFAFLRREPSRVSKNLEGNFLTSFASFSDFFVDLTVRRNFLLKLAKALLYFGAPPHRIESQLIAADAILDTRAGLSILSLRRAESQNHLILI